MIVLIPAYRPDASLLGLLDGLRSRLPDAEALVVDDGSGPAFDEVFDGAAHRGAIVLRHVENHGKGHALRAGLAWLREWRPGAGVVTADADGQHTPDAIASVAAAIAPRRLVLGVRRFTGEVPLRSRLGNAVSRWLFRLAEGTNLADTQTGLRGAGPDTLSWLLGVPGDRYDYEFAVLLGARKAGFALEQVPISTVYLDDNASSHFRPIRDSALVYAPLLAFTASSLACFGLDFVAWTALWWTFGNAALAAVGARVLSASANFVLNREVTFGHTGPRGAAALRYAGLAAAILAANAGLLVLLIDVLGVPGLLAKILVEAGLFCVSYAVQRRFVFAGTPLPARDPRPASARARLGSDRPRA